MVSDWRRASAIFNLITGLSGILAGGVLLLLAGPAAEGLLALLPAQLLPAHVSLLMLLVLVAAGFTLLNGLRFASGYGLWSERAWGLSFAKVVHTLFAVLELLAFPLVLVMGLAMLALVTLAFCAANTLFAVRLGRMSVTSDE